jgi:transposase
MSTQARRRYSEEFKREAVRLVTEQGYPQQQVARNLGIDRSLVGRWRRELAEGSGSAAKTMAGGGEQEELQRLRGEVRQLRMERDILKKALAFFAKESN